MNVVHGVDGCRRGWIRVSLDLSNKKLSAKVFETTEALFKDGPVPITGIDIPIGLPDAANPKMVSQLSSLERRVARGGRDSIDHAPGAHDDVANAVAGVLTLIVVGPQPLRLVAARWG